MVEQSTAEHEVCPSCGCYEHCTVPEGKPRICEHCDGEPPHRPRCQWSEANLAEQYDLDVRNAMTFYPQLPSSREVREGLEDCGFLDWDHEWTPLGERVGLAIRGRQSVRFTVPAEPAQAEPPSRRLVPNAPDDSIWYWDTDEHVREIRRLQERVAELEASAATQSTPRHPSEIPGRPAGAPHGRPASDERLPGRGAGMRDLSARLAPSGASAWARGDLGKEVIVCLGPVLRLVHDGNKWFAEDDARRQWTIFTVGDLHGAIDRASAAPKEPSPGMPKMLARDDFEALSEAACAYAEVHEAWDAQDAPTENEDEALAEAGRALYAAAIRATATPQGGDAGPDPRDAEIERLRAAVHRDQTGLAAAMNKIKAVALGYSWIGAGEWGSYEWQERTVETLQREIRLCLDEIDERATAALAASGRLAQETLVPAASHDHFACEPAVVAGPKSAVEAWEDDAELVRRAVANLGRAGRRPLQRWGRVADAFGLGSTFAKRLCVRLGLDPDDVVWAGQAEDDVDEEEGPC